jgi:hypothetical protein
MPIETFPEAHRKEQRGDMQKDNRLERLLPLLREEALRLREQGFPVTDDCRLDASAFGSQYATRELQSDALYVRNRESRFDREANTGVGELLEVVKTLAFNQLWFKGKLVAVRTTKYDDYKNGIDEIVFDLETRKPLAVVDTTTNWKTKVEQFDFMKKIEHGGTVKYGVGIGGEGVEKTAYDTLPIFVVSLNPEEVARLAGEIIRGRISEASDLLERVIMKELLMQSEALGRLPSVPSGIREQYSVDRSIFERLAA